MIPAAGEEGRLDPLALREWFGGFGCQGRTGRGTFHVPSFWTAVDRWRAELEGIDHRARRQQCGTLDDAAQLTHVPWKRMTRELCQCRGPERESGELEALAGVLEEQAREAPLLAFAFVALRQVHASSDEIYGPGAAVQRFFDAASRGDCPALKQGVTGKLARDLASNGCAPTFQRMRAHQLEYLDSGQPKVDGRDDRARLVPIRVRFDRKPLSLLVRVSRDDDTWKLATL